jgi:hypothetical protein
MIAETETLGYLAQSVAYRKYEVDSRRFNLQITDPVTPGTIIGWHHKSGQPVVSDVSGQIATIYYNPMHDSLMITVTATMLNRGDNPNIASRGLRGRDASLYYCVAH